MKKKWYIIIGIILLIFIMLIYFLFVKDSKFYLEKDYYNNNGVSEIELKDLESLMKEKKSFVLLTYNNFCAFPIPCEKIFESSAKSTNIEILKIPFTEFKKSKLHNEVKYAPSVIVIKKGKIVDYLDAESNDDYQKYQDESEFVKWLDSIIYFSIE